MYTSMGVKGMLPLGSLPLWESEGVTLAKFLEDFRNPICAEFLQSKDAR